MFPRLAGVALTVVIAGSHAFGQTPQAPPDTQIPAVISLPPLFERVLRDYEAAWRDGDGPRLAALFTEDGFAPSPLTHGADSLASRCRQTTSCGNRPGFTERPTTASISSRRHHLFLLLKNIRARLASR